MRISTREYLSAGVWVSVVTMDPGDYFPAYSPGNILGGFLVYGAVAAVVNGVEGEMCGVPGWTTGTADGPWRLAWEDPTRARGKGRYRAGIDGAQWVCIMGGCAVIPQAVVASYTVPASTRFLAAKGELEFDGLLCEQGRLFAPRDADMDVTGTGDILMLG